MLNPSAQHFQDDFGQFRSTGLQGTAASNRMSEVLTILTDLPDSEVVVVGLSLVGGDPADGRVVGFRSLRPYSGGR